MNIIRHITSCTATLYALITVSLITYHIINVLYKFSRPSLHLYTVSHSGWTCTYLQIQIQSKYLVFYTKLPIAPEAASIFLVVDSFLWHMLRLKFAFEATRVFTRLQYFYIELLKNFFNIILLQKRKGFYSWGISLGLSSKNTYASPMTSILKFDERHSSKGTPGFKLFLVNITKW